MEVKYCLRVNESKCTYILINARYRIEMNELLLHLFPRNLHLEKRPPNGYISCPWQTKNANKIFNPISQINNNFEIYISYEG
jgi:hypothetical protein